MRLICRCLVPVPVALFAFSLIVACGSGDVTSSRSYKGHESDRDMNNFVNVYKNTVGTRLDDCQTCHRGGQFTYLDSKGKTQTTWKNQCDYCHLKEHRDPTFIEPQPKTFYETLNPFGAAYIEAGRSRDGLRAMGNTDSDNDTFSNNAEAAALTYPGDPLSKPGQKQAPSVTLTMAQVQKLTSHSEFLLANATKQRYDDYANYSGVKIIDLLSSLGVNVDSGEFQGITTIAPDGFMKDFTIDEVLTKYPAGLYFSGLDTTTKGETCGFVNYPANIPSGLVDGGEIPGEQWLMLGYSREGKPLVPAWLDVGSGKLDGEGPFRIIVPQENPGKPDRGSQYPAPTCTDGYEFNSSADHNAGEMIRGIVGIRVNPLQAGVEDFDVKNGGWAYIQNSTIVIYGYGIKGK